ncbi:MAG: uracil-DNA glycosylase [Pseudomonadota bacterium]
MQKHSFVNVSHDCPLCPRLVEFRRQNQQKYPTYFNGPVPVFGGVEARFAIVGLAPGLHGANQTGRPFTGDYAGELLYKVLKTHDFATGHYGRVKNDGFDLKDCKIINAVRCVPPANKPIGAEINKCRPFLLQELQMMKNLQAILVLGNIAHQSFLRAINLRVSQYAFGHGLRYKLGDHHALAKPLILFTSYHCSRYNVNTNRLSEAMFDQVIQSIRQHLD